MLLHYKFWEGRGANKMQSKRQKTHSDGTGVIPALAYVGVKRNPEVLLWICIRTRGGNLWEFETMLME